MATFDLGKLKFNWRGDYADSTAYETDDVVFHKNSAWIATADIASSNTTDPEANDDFTRMASGVDFQTDDFSTSTAYYLNDLVKHSNAVYIVTSETVTADTGEDPSTLTNDFAIFSPAPEGNVLTTDGDMLIRRGGNNIRIPITKTVDKGLTVQKHKTETYPSRSFTYTEDNDNAVTQNKAGSVPAATYTITVKNRGDDSYIVSGSDRNGNFNEEEEYTINVNIGDTLVFNTEGVVGDHPLHIRVSDQGDSITAGTGGSYSGEGEDEVEWNTTGSSADTYFYQSENDNDMIGEIVVTDITNQQGSSSEQASIDVTRGEEYTITFTGLTDTIGYNLFTTAGGHTGNTGHLTEAEGNSDADGITFGTSDIEHTFTPNQTTPDTIYITDKANGDAQLTINVHDPIYVPSWGEADASVSSGALDQREFKYWQQWYGGECADQTSGVISSYGITLPTSTRDPGSKVKVDGTAVGAQQQRLSRADSGGATVDWTVPDGVEKVRITCIGGGGGGGSYSSHYYGGCGGGGGAFASGEYTVAEGDTLRIVAGHGGFGSYGGTGGSGGTTTVQDVDGSTVGAKVNVSAEGGHGGAYAQSYGDGGDEVTLSGSSLQSGNQYKYAGGNGGRGAWNYNSYGYDGHTTGGGGSAGSMYGHGFRGGEGRAYMTGYHCSHSGGGGIGGAGGHGTAAYRGDTHGPCSGGGGGGSAGPGQNGNRAPIDGDGTSYFPWSPPGGDGGAGLADGIHVANYIDIMPEVAGRSGAKGSVRNELDGATDLEYDGYMIQMAGGRFGDGEQEHPTAGWDVDDTTLSRGPYTRIQQNKFGARQTNTEIEYTAKAWNGVLGRLWGGGGAGGGDTHVNTSQQQSNGGEGGSGGGGGGSCQYQYYSGPGPNARIGKEFFCWDWANMAWRWSNKHRVGNHPGLVTTGTDYGYYISAYGGPGGALGGGGGGGTYGCEGGYGGIGGGGGGGSNTYSPVAPGSGGHGGVGYVLIEWPK